MPEIIIITNKGFPEAYASTVRFTSYSLGLLNAGIGVLVHCITPTEKKHSVRNYNVKGFYKKIEYKYTSGTTVISGNLPMRFLVKIYGLLVSLFQILLIQKRRDISAILLIGPFGLFREILYFMVSRILGIKFIQERTESPEIGNSKSPIFWMNLWVYKHLSCQMYDAMIVISNALYEYFNKFVSRKARIFVMPITVDLDRFISVNPLPENAKYIAYCGSMNKGKDGVEILVEAFDLISRDYPDISLKLIGRTDFIGFDQLSDYVKSLKCHDKIEFTGQVSNQRMADLLSQAKLLALARPETKQSQYNFPTKIGEYLATGKPVVITNVGVVADFLRHGENAYLANPGDVDDFIKNLRLVLDNYTDALKVGSEGQKLARKEFSHLYQGSRLADFLTGL